MTSDKPARPEARCAAGSGPIIIPISFGHDLGGLTVETEDPALAAQISYVFDCAAETTQAASEPPAETGNSIFRIKGKGAYRVTLEEGEACGLTASQALGFIDARCDELLRSQVNEVVCTTHTLGIAVPSGEAIALMGTSHAGKTTLGLACCAAGFELMGDEFGFLNLASGTYRQARYPLCVRDGTRAVLRSPLPEGIPLETPRGAQPSIVPLREVRRALAPNAPAASTSALPQALCAADRALPLRAIVAPMRREHVEPGFARLERLSVTRWPDCIMPSVASRGPRDQLFRTLVALASRANIEVLTLSYADANDAAKLMAAHWLSAEERGKR